MAQGIGSSRICRELGISRRTGTRWRYGRREDRPGRQPLFYPPVATAPPPVISARFLSVQERLTIADLHRAGRSGRFIAAELHRSPSTISREIARNADEGTGEYRPHAAQSKAAARRPRSSAGKLAGDPELRDFVQSCLEKRWSPEQISKVLPTEFPDQPGRHVVHETIYQALYVSGRGLTRELTKSLRTQRVRRKPHRKGENRRARSFVDPMVMITDRPVEVLDRAVAGHWEGDLITGARNVSAIGTMVERTTRFVVLLHLPDDHSAATVRDALIAAMDTFPQELRRSLTWDQGGEMAYHRGVTIATGMPVFFCEPRSPWQRGSNENTNGLLRQYFRKSSDLSVYTREHLDVVAAELNGRPRKVLGWQTPPAQLAKLLASEN
ncbi:IS30 family transposase [Nakamurella panacisegetis]